MLDLKSFVVDQQLMMIVNENWIPERENKINTIEEARHAG